MKHTRKILIALLVVMTLLVGVFSVTASADGGTTIYLDPNDNWIWQDIQRFAVRCWNSSGEVWIDMHDSDADGVYEAQIPSGYTQFIICRMDGSTTANNWDNRWNQTADLTIPADGNNCYYITGNRDHGQLSSGEWRKYESTCSHNWEVTESKEASCLEGGYVNSKCSICSATKSDPTQLTGHNYVNNICSVCSATTKDTVVYFDNTAGWDKVYCYTWQTGKGDTIKWPGTEMTKVEGEENLYSYTVPAGQENIIFHNNGDDATKAQTADLVTPSDCNILYSYSAKAWTIKHIYGEDNKCTLCGSFAEHDCQWSEATCQFAKQCSICGKFDGTPVAHGTEGCTCTLVKLNNLAGWTNANAYYADANWAAPIAWPGTAMTTTDNGATYTFLVPEGMKYVIINSGDGKQTDDLLVAEGLEVTNLIVELRGSMNEWNGQEMTVANGVATLELELSANTYELKILLKSLGEKVYVETWLGNTGTIDNTTVKEDCPNGWEMTDTGDVNCKLNALGGSYTFKFNLETKMLIVEFECLHGENADLYVKNVIAPTCLEGGKTVNTCSVCGHSYEDAPTDAKGHDKSTTTVDPTCVAQGYDLTKCSRCDLEEKSNYVDATGKHTYVDFACSVCSAAMPAVESDGGKKVYDFNDADGFAAIQADAYIALSGTFRLNNGGCHQMYLAGENREASKVQFVVPAHRSVTIEGHSAGYGKLYVKINDEIKEITTGSLTFETSEETKVEITAVNDSESYIKSITVEIPKIIGTDALLTFKDGGTYDDFGIDFSGIEINNAGRGSDAQVKNGSFTFAVKAGAVVLITSYHQEQYVNYKINAVEEVHSQYYYIYVVNDTTITYEPINSDNYLVSIEIKFHEGLKNVAAVAPKCESVGYTAYIDCDCCEGTLTEKTEVPALGHDLTSYEAKAPTCTAIGWDAYVTCSRCDYSTYAEKAALGHTWVDATCTAAKYCSVCQVQDGEPLGHDWADATCTSPKDCTRCDATDGEALGHVWNEGVVTTQPTCAVEGVKTFSCTNCDETKTEAVPVVDHTYYYTLCLVCYAPNPYYIQNDIKVGENKVVCNQYHLVANGEGQHGKPFEFPFITIEKDGVYKFSSNDNISIFVYTIEITTEGADFSDGGASWGAVDMDGEVELKAGKYYVGFIYLDGEGEYTVTVELVPPHEHNFVEGKCECGESDPDYKPEEKPEDTKPEDTKPEDTKPEPQPEQPKLNFFQKIWQAILNFFKKLFGGKK